MWRGSVPPEAPRPSPARGSTHAGVWKRWRYGCWGVKNPNESGHVSLVFASKCFLHLSFPHLELRSSQNPAAGFCFPENLASRSPGEHSVPTGKEQPN